MITQQAPTSITSFSSGRKFEITPCASTQTKKRVPLSLLNRKWTFESFTRTSKRTKQIHFSRPLNLFQRRYGLFSKALARDQETPEPSKNAETRYTYDIFLSFRGEDTRNNFVDHLRNALHQRGITTFRDDSDRDLPRGKSISPELIRAIEESRYVLVIFSENYASSTWCLDEVSKIVECKDIVGGSVVPIFYKINPSDIRKIKGSIQRDFAKHEERFKDEAQKLEKWKAALKIVASLSGRELNDGYESKFIQELVSEIENRLGPRFSYVANNVVGIQSRVAKVIDHLHLGERDVWSIGICGMGGIGKTTIARAVYDSVCSQFEGSSFLANVREVSGKNGLIHLQNQLLRDILKDNSLSIEDVHKGANKIKERLQYKKVVLILDDVDDKEQLEYLARDHSWFGQGTRIIITTRDEHLLDLYGVKMIYKAEKLINEEALELFCSKAFKSNYPPKEFNEVSKKVIGYCDGLPLALDVLGSFLCNRSLRQWQSALARLKECPEEKIFSHLRISYDGLQDKEKEIFLDIACFFKGKDKSYVMEILDNCGFYPDIGIEVLIDRSLISIEDDKLWMHDLLQDMAWQIIRQESPKEPGKRSRVWLFEDLHHILMNNSGTEKLEGVVLQSNPLRAMEVDGESFTKMTNLRLLDIRIRAIHLSSEIKHLSNELRILTWDNCNLESFPPNFYPQNILELNMRNSQFIELWRGEKIFKKLKVIDLTGSKALVVTPNFRDVPNLERLTLKSCKGLYEVHPSIGVLERLNILDLSECENLMRLPESVGNLKSLRVLDLSGCSNLEELPEHISSLECLEELDISGTAIMHLPSSLTFLKNLKTLCLHGCKGPQSMFLKGLMLTARNTLKSRHSRLTSFSGLSSLMELDMSDCNLQEGEIPGDIGCLSSLTSLDLSQNNFISIPASINLISSLEILALNHCEYLKALPRLPESIIFVEADKCLRLTRISNPFIVCTVPGDGFCFINCSNLFPEGLDLTLQQKYSLSLLRYIICCSVITESRTYVVSPESGVPEWFSFQHSGSSVGIDSPPHWIHAKWRGFMICAYFEQCSCYTSMDQDFPQFLSCRFLVGTNQLGPMLSFPIRFVNSGCVWLGFVPHFLFPSDIDWQAMSKRIDILISINNPRIKIEKCGVQPVYKHDPTAFDEFLIKWASSLSGDCGSIYDEFLQPPKYHTQTPITRNITMGAGEVVNQIVSCGVSAAQFYPRKPEGRVAAE